MSNNFETEYKAYGTVDEHLKNEKSRKRTTARLVLEDGEVIEGVSFGYEKSVSGEVVFNTGMVGYPESLTDPSYCGQILVITYPLIGNYGVPSEDVKDKYNLLKYFESDKIQVTALIISDYCEDHSHYFATSSLSQWLKKHKIPALHQIDTRKLTKKIRVKGAMLGKIEFNADKIDFVDPNKLNLVQMVSRKQVTMFNYVAPVESKRDNDEDEVIFMDEKEEETVKTIIAIDCGIKNNIIRYLCSKKVNLKVVPWDYDFTNDKFDGVFISNGPGDPRMATKTIEIVRKFMQKNTYTPLFGICLGNQILALAAGAKTFKMKFGNRGMNQPVIDLRTSRCYISPQNHGFAVDENSLPKDWKPFFRNANDHTNEGIIHSYKPYFSVQFHPEAKGGPTDTEFLFNMFMSRIREKMRYEVTIVDTPLMTKPDEVINKVLLLGSGGLTIGQAGEFDYSGSQAIKALKEENLFVVLVNPNIATVQTSDNMADEVYFLPITPEYVTKVIEKERPNGILLQFGGQSALNCGIELMESGVLDKYNVRVLGTSVQTIQATEDRELFANKLKEVGEKVAPSSCAKNVDECVRIAHKIGYPVLLRSAYALGGLGSGFAKNEEELRELATKALSSCEQVIIDKSLRGWKEVEYEVVRDINNNCITVCNMENFDPLGIHTGDSIVVAPSQTLSNHEYYMLRSAAIKVVRHLGVVGECNIQYALDPHSSNYCVIEVNARLSRSSALASKATGYPLAYVAAKLALGRSLPSIKNSVTKVTQACFEPSLDYCVVKIPRWDMTKFNSVSYKIGSAMKSVGEVMAIDRKFEAAFCKALRMVHDQCDGFGDIPQFVRNYDSNKIDAMLTEPSDVRVFVIAQAFKRGYSVDKIYSLTKIDPWFLCKLRNVIVLEKWLGQLKINNVSAALLRRAKQDGFSDAQIGRACGAKESEVREYRLKLKITPFVKQIDTLAAEFPAATNYLYMTYNGNEHDLQFDEHGVIVLGCGAYRIGSSCEFDWCAVSAVRCLKSLVPGSKNEAMVVNKIVGSSTNKKKHSRARQQRFSSVVINYNPETVSTDYDECDRLYFEELSLERVLDIYQLEQSLGIVVSVGGQISNNLAMPLHEYGCTILGTQPDSIDTCENRHRFSKLCDALNVHQPQWSEISTLKEAQKFAQKVGYPVLIRPSYVLSGAAMNVVSSEVELSKYIKQATDVSKDHPVVVTKFISGAKEIEFDGVACNGVLLNYAISEHVEHAGVHSGDATLILPPQNIYVETFKRLRSITKKICASLKISGPFNVQYLCKNNDIKVIECNLRASRSFPFVSKTFNINFIDQAMKAIMEPNAAQSVSPVNFNLFDIDYVCVKCPVFSFSRLQGADPVLKVEMSSTGEVACFGSNKYEAFLKALRSANFNLPVPNPTRSPCVERLRLDYIEADCMRSLIDDDEYSSHSPSPSTHNELVSVESYSNLRKSLLAKMKSFNAFKSSIIISIGPEKAKFDFVESCLMLHQMGFTLYCTDNTHLFFQTHNIPSVLVHKPLSAMKPNVLDLVSSGKVHLVLNVPGIRKIFGDAKSDGYLLRRKCVDFSVPLLSNLQGAKLFVQSLAKKYFKSYEHVNDNDFLHIKSWREYLQSKN